MRQLNPLFFTFFLLATCLQAQEKPWQNIAEKDIPTTGQRYISASNARTVRLNWDALEQVLAAAPLETSPTSRISSTYLDLPMPSGEMMRFRILESPIMEAGLAQKFPDIETYAGVAMDDEATFVRFDVTPQGFHAIILSPNFSTVYIDPYNFSGNRNDYLVYHRKDFVPLVPKEFNCYFQNAGDINENRGRNPNPGWRFGDCRHRTYRLALSATGEYTTFHGGTVALAQAAQVTTMNRVNAILERELAIRLNIIANNNLLIYTNAATDPYTNGTTGTMINENQTNTTTVIGSANYDIGHVFGTNSGGLASLASVCVGPSKARGVTGSAAPVGDAFDVDYVAHEMGHQFGANHTFNNSCSGNRNTATAYETGSGSTIMSYAGICAPDVQNQVHDNYHGASLQEMGTFITSAGHTCPVTATLPNTAPVITSPSAAVNFNVPISTPFFLSSTATDPDANTLTYSWEQMNNQISTQAPVATATSGPNFRVFAPSTNPIRYFPRLADLAANITPTWEVLPNVARTMNFRIIVRDNATGGGCTTHRDNISVTFASAAGPFSVTSPSLTGITWAGAANQTITWNVANTTAAPVSCPNVDIRLSTDGGLTYPTVLATGVPNNGTAVILAPSINTSTARVQIVCSNNIFFDISNNNFSITAATSDYTLSVNPPSASVCPPNTATYTVSVGSIGGFSNSVTLSTTGLAAGLTATFSPATVTPAGTAILTISGTGSVSPNTYNFNIQGAGSTGTKIINASLVVTNPAPTSPTLTTPANGATNIATTPTFTWTTVAGVGITYDIQIATDAIFGNIVSSASGLTTTTFIPSTALATNTAHFWRVRAVNACGAGSFSPIFSFTTSNISCSIFNATNVPRTISPTGINTTLSTMTIPSLGGNIVDVDVINLAGTHSYFGDLRISVSSPSATSVRLVGNTCTNTTNFNLNFDDAAGSGVIPCPPNTGGTFIPASLLAAFNGQNPTGVWTLRVLDSADVDGGSLNSWGLRICVAPVACSITLTSTQNNVLCNASCTGLAAAAPAGAIGAVSYVWSNGATGQTVNNLCAGVYSVTATDANACAATRSVTITQPTAIVAALAATATNCTPNTGSIVSTVSGGTPTYTFAWSNSNTTANISGLAPNIYSVIITDANGCSVSRTATVVNGCTVTPCSITLTSTQTNVLCNGVCIGAAAVSPAGAIGVVSYIWLNGATGQTVNNLCAGVYSVTATDANACTATRSITITQPTAIVAALAATATNCTPNTGSIVSTVSGGTPTYTFAWSNSNTTSNISGLAPNIYSVIITDANGCSVSRTATVANGCTVTPCSITLTSTQNNVLCNGVCTGVAAVSPAGAIGVVSYIWSNGATGQTVNNLCAGVYSVTATDANACAATRSITITQPTAIVAALSATATNCTPNTGSIVSTVSGGTPTYTFAWSNSNTTSNISGLAPNIYSVIITDANGCSVSRTATVANGCTVTPCSITLTSTQNNVLCNASCTGLAAVSPAGVIGVVSYIWSNGATGQTVNNLCAGVYSVTATDANACTATRSITITQPTAIVAALSASATNCTPNTGSIVSTVSGGTPTYTFAWSNSNTTANISGLAPNTYNVIITDANGCSVSRTATVANGCTVTPVSCTGTQSVSVTVGNPNCNGVCNGFAFAIPSGFSGNIASYNWSNGRSGQTVANLCAGVYTVTVTDVNGCVATANNTITQPAAITITGSVTNPSCCANGNDGNISITATGGTAGYTFAWSNSRTSQNISALTGGNYSVIVTDANSCSVSSSPFILNNPSQLVATAAISPTSCSIGGSANAVVAGGTAPYSYLWDNGQSAQVSTGLTSGAHLVTITDNNGCRLIYTVAIPNGCVCGIVVTNTITQASCTNTCDGAIQIGLTNANGQIRYTWNNGRTTQNVSGLCPNTYILTVTDANNCTATVNNLVINNPAPIISVISTTNASCNGTDGRATISLTGGTNPYTFNWSNGQQSSTASGLNAGVYPIIATDANGCSVVRAATVGLSNSLAVTNPVVVQNASCFGVANGAAFISAAGANNISYLWSNGEATSSASALPGGVSTITVSSAGGCVATRTVTINSPSQIVLNLISTQLNCVPNTGAIAAIVSGGSGSGYQFNWSNGQSGTTISGLNSGQYSLSVTDGNNCAAVSTTNISIATPPLVVLTHTNPTCNTLADISATISPAGNYTFLWSNGSTTQNLSGIAGGIYQLEVRNGNCVTTVRDTVPTASPIDINFSVTLPTNPQTQDGSLSATASNGTAPFSYVWNTGATGSVLVGIGSGLYIVSVSDASGCTAIDSFQLGSITNITESGNNIEFVIQPNPSAGEFNLILQSAIVGEYQIRLYDVLGRTLWQQELSSPQLILPINMSHLPAACYFVSVQQRGKISTQKLIIAK